MKVELHLHTSRYSGCAANTPAEMMEALIAAGYDAVFITEHSVVWPLPEIDELQKAFPQIRIFPGVELSFGTATTQHLLVLGASDASYLACPTAAAAIVKARAEGNLAILAHPFRWPGGDAALEGPPLPDAIEHRTGNQDAKGAHEAVAAAERLGLPLVNSGDSHSVAMINRHWIQTRRPLERATDIRQIILDGDYENCSGE